MANREIKFNDEFVKPRLEKLIELEIGEHTIAKEQIKRVQEILEIDGDTLEELQAKRNSVVKLLTEDRDDEKSWNTMSGVVFVIDSRLWDLTGEC